MNKLLFTNLTLLLSICTFAQTALPEFGNNHLTFLDKFSTNTGLMPVFDLRYDGVKGTPYFYPEFTEGEVFLTKSRHMSKEYLYKFDEEKNTVEVKGKDNKEKVLIASEVEAVKLYIQGKTVTYFRMDVPNDKNLSRLFQVLYVGDNYTLVKLPLKKVERVDNTGAYNTGELYDKYADKGQYFLKSKHKNFEEIRMTKRSLLKAMPQKRKILEAFFEDHEGSIKDYEIAQLLVDSEK